jgi:diguanylate cyclase (GGDEF)-like protein
MFKIINIEDINARLGRDMGTETIVKISNLIKTKISSEYIFVRYMGPKFAIVFSGIEMDGVVNFVKVVKEEIGNMKIEKGEEESKDKKKLVISPKTNFVVASYYKGTGLEEVTKKLEQYLDEADAKESNINCI